MRNRKHDIEKYLRGELSPAEMHALEKEALNDPFLAEALEGVEQAGADNFLYDLHTINRSIHDRSRKRSRKNNPTIRMWGWTAGIAATVLLVAVSGFLVVSLLKEQRARELAMNEPAPVPLQQEMKSRDSLTVVMPREHARPTEQQSGAPPRLSEPIASAQEQKPAESRARENPVVDDVLVTEDAAVRQAKDAEALRARAESDKAEAERQESVAAVQEQRVAEEQIAAAREAERAEDTREQGALSKRKQARAAGAEASRMPASTSAPAPDSILLRGKVVAAVDGSELPGVNVMIKGSAKGTVTDAEGNYQLSVPTDNAHIVFSFIGYASQEVAANQQRQLNVQLEEDVAALSEVVVTGYSLSGTREAPDEFSFAEPEGGRTDFKNYLNTTVKYPEEAVKNKAEGRVTVRFTVGTNGELKDFEVLKGIGFGCEEELIRAIRQGPSWKPSRQGDNPLPDKVKVRFKFALPQ